MPRAKKKLAPETKPESDLNFEDKLWKAADHLRGSMDASEYKNIVLGLIFLKYIADAFEERRLFLDEATRNPKNTDYYCKDEKAGKRIVEDPDEYTSEGVFFVPKAARWKYIQDNATQPNLGLHSTSKRTT